MTGYRPVMLPLAAMLLTQTAASMSLSTVPVLAPLIAADAGVDAGNVGTYTALVFGAAMMSSSASGALIVRFGPLRSNQLALLVSALGLLLCVTPLVIAIVASALLLGLGYGPNTPSSAQVLARVTPAHNRGFVFSVKQSGSPLGAIAAGLLLPWLASERGWQSAVVATSVLIVAAAVVVQPLRQRSDFQRRTSALAVEPMSVAVAVRTVLASAELRQLTLAAFLMMIVHTCMQAFTVTFLVEHVELDLVLAGELFAVLSLSAFVSRIALGWLSDSRVEPVKVLTGVSLCATLACVALARLSSDWSVWTSAAACAFAGFASSGWYGVFLAEISRRASSGHEGLATGGALFFVYGSIVIGPLLFMATRFAAGSYPAGLYMLAVVSALAALVLFRAR